MPKNRKLQFHKWSKNKIDRELINCDRLVFVLKNRACTYLYQIWEPISLHSASNASYFVKNNHNNFHRYNYRVYGLYVSVNLLVLYRSLMNMKPEAFEIKIFHINMIHFLNTHLCLFFRFVVPRGWRRDMPSATERNIADLGRIRLLRIEMRIHRRQRKLIILSSYEW